MRISPPNTSDENFSAQHLKFLALHRKHNRRTGLDTKPYINQDVHGKAALKLDVSGMPETLLKLRRTSEQRSVVHACPCVHMCARAKSVGAQVLVSQQIVGTAHPAVQGCTTSG